MQKMMIPDDDDDDDDDHHESKEKWFRIKLLLAADFDFAVQFNLPQLFLIDENPDRCNPMKSFVLIQFRVTDRFKFSSFIFWITIFNAGISTKGEQSKPLECQPYLILQSIVVLR